jgi:hypothetical protein
MKASKQCPKCHGHRVGHLENVTDKDVGHETAVLGFSHVRGKWLGDSGEAVGSLEAYLCAECGYYETYVKDPGSVPYDEMKGFHWVNDPPPPEGAYR